MNAHPMAGKTLRYTVIVVGAIALVSYGSILTSRYQTMRRSLEFLGGVKLLDSREEVIYRLGHPATVLGPAEKNEHGSWQICYTVNAPVGDKNGMPNNSKIQDYIDWQYDRREDLHLNARLDIGFSLTGTVDNLGWYADDQSATAWGPIAGIYNGDSEEMVLKLGPPSSSSLDGATKTLDYRDLGLEVTLVKGRTYRAVLHAGHRKEWAVFKRFLRTLP